MPATDILLWSVLFSSIGLGYFIYGKKQRKLIPFIIGISLMIFPYFVTGVWMLVILGVVLSVIPYFLRL